MIFNPTPFGRYFLLDLLETGGLAEIYLAKLKGESGFEKILTIKKLHPQRLQDQEMTKMLIDEAKILVHLSHPNIVQVFELGQNEGVHYIAMEYVEGSDLRKILKGTKVSTEVAVFITREILKGLEYAHEKTDRRGNPLKIVHRDISPANILISLQGEVKITDFGIARARGKTSETLDGTLKGKLSYMSPEQAAGELVDSRSDLFSAGLILYEMLAGKKTFDGKDDFETLRLVQQVDIGIPQGIHENLAEILRRFLAKDRQDRYPTAGEAEHALAKFAFDHLPPVSSKEIAQLVRSVGGSPRSQEVFQIKTSSVKKGTEIISREEKAKIYASVISQKSSYRKPAAVFGLFFFVAVIVFTIYFRKPSPPINVISEKIVPEKSTDVSAKPSPVEPEKEPAQSIASPPTSESYGLLTVQAFPWGKVTVGNRVSEDTPLSELKLPMGTHKVTVTYPPTGKKVSKKVFISKNQAVTCTARFLTKTPDLECLQN